MALVLALAALAVLLGMVMRLPRYLIWASLFILVLAVLLIAATLPATNPLRQMIGGTFTGWLIVAAIAVAVLGYGWLLSWLHARAPEMTPQKSPELFSKTELERYARHIVLREIGGVGQQRLKKARVLVVGAGGLGSPALLYLAAAGVGTIGVVDDDEVSLSNLQRQVLHNEDRIGMPKVFSAQQGLNAINPHVDILPYQRRLTGENARDLIAGFDLVLDGSDNFNTRYLVNETCVSLKKPLISAAISQWEGQISVYDPANGTPCYACVFPTPPADGLAPTCAEAGVMGALPGVVGAMMAVEALKEITGAGEPLKGEMLIYDALYGESRKLHLERRAECKVCGHPSP